MGTHPWNMRNITVKTTNYTLIGNDDVLLVDATSGVITITLPKISIAEGCTYVVKKVDSSSNAVTIDPDGSETIDGATTHVLSSQYDRVEFIADAGRGWHIIGT